MILESKFKIFLDQFDVFKDVLQECLTNNVPTYEIFNETDKMRH